MHSNEEIKDNTMIKDSKFLPLRNQANKNTQLYWAMQKKYGISSMLKMNC